MLTFCEGSRREFALGQSFLLLFIIGEKNLITVALIMKRHRYQVPDLLTREEAD